VALVAIVAKAVLHRRSSASQRPPIEPDVDIRISTFLTWLRDKGGTISPKVTLAAFPDFGGYGIQAKNGRLHKHEDLFTIPPSAIVTAEWVLRRYDPFREEIEKTLRKIEKAGVFRKSEVRQDFVIALHLMVECSKGASSEMWPYLQMLPDHVPRMDTFDEETLKMLEDDHLAGLARQSKSELSTAWNEANLESLTWTLAEISSRREQGDKGAYKGCLTFDSFHHYVTISSSRAMILENGTKYLTPLADMMNHKESEDREWNEPFVQFHTRNPDGSITVSADREVSGAGEQVFEAYGTLDNSLYLEAFGFVPEDNADHCAMIQTEFVPNYDEALKLFKQLGFSETPDVCLFSDGGVANPEGKYFLAFSMLESTEGQVERCREALEQLEVLSDPEDEYREGVHQHCFEYAESDRLVWALAGRAYCWASTTIAQDEALLRRLRRDRRRESAKKAVAVQFRMEEKKTLLKAASGLLPDGRQFTCDKIQYHDEDGVL